MTVKNILENLWESKTFRIFLSAIFALVAAVMIYALAVNAYVVDSTEDLVLSLSRVSEIEDADCILVLGCLVKSDGTPSDMLHDRLLTATEVYYQMEQAGNQAPLLMSGDSGTEGYDEVGAMRDFAVSAGVREEILLDPAGFSTFESVARAKELFDAEKIVIVTQSYHLHRALFIAEALGVEAYGVSADVRSYRNQFFRDVREILARNKDFLQVIFSDSVAYNG
jgi:vancomycin permeability regulator SanA